MLANKNKRNLGDNGFADEGGYMAVKKAKLRAQLAESNIKEDGPKIFNGLSFHIVGHTSPPFDELKKCIITNGGIIDMYKSAKTSYIVASNLPDRKVKELKVYNVVKPAWIVDSSTASKLLDHHKYLLHSNQSKTQPKLNFFFKKENSSSHLTKNS